MDIAIASTYSTVHVVLRFHSCPPSGVRILNFSLTQLILVLTSFLHFTLSDSSFYVYSILFYPRGGNLADRWRFKATNHVESHQSYNELVELSKD